MRQTATLCANGLMDFGKVNPCKPAHGNMAATFLISKISDFERLDLPSDAVSCYTKLILGSTINPLPHNPDFK